MKFPFEPLFDEVQENIDEYVSAVFSCLESEFLVLPRGDGFVEYPVFEAGYEALKRATGNFENITPTRILQVVSETPISIIVLRTILGFTPPEWAYVATQHTGTEVSQSFARSLDRKIRMDPLKPPGKGKITVERVKALIKTACLLLSEGTPQVESDKIHRLDKADTKEGSETIRMTAEIGAPYAMLLYERFLGRPFAGHRDSVSELIGDSLETKIRRCSK